MKYEMLPWLTLFLPIFSAAAITLFTLKHRNVSALISIGAIVAGFVMTLVFIHANGFQINVEDSIVWLSIGGLNIDFGLKLDALSLMMMLIVTGVGGAIHIYSYGYMDDDPGKARFFAELSLFTFSMLGIVLANNFIEMFIFWELVGVSSYLLIGFWFEKPSAADAAKKAFFTNRLGDFGFLRRDRQIRAISAARLAAGRHGRPDARQRAHPRRDDGGRRRLHALPHFLFAQSRCAARRRVYRGIYRIARRAHRRPAGRH